MFSRKLTFCTCPVCSVIKDQALFADSRKAKTRKEPLQKGVEQLQVVPQGLRRFVIYDREKPWKRVMVNGCTNPAPLARRRSPVGLPLNAVLNDVYHYKMLMPGKVIHAQPSAKASRTSAIKTETSGKSLKTQ